MDEQDKSKPAPFCIRLTHEQRGFLEDQAGNIPLGTYIRQRLLGEKPQRRNGKRPLKDQKALAQVQAMLGASRISSNLNQLAKAMNSGSLPVNRETREAILKACKDIEFMRQELVRALGLRPPK